MRTLTVRTEKNFAGKFGKTVLYMTDPDSGNATVNGEPCRLLGKVKAGEEESFEITEKAVRIYSYTGTAEGKDICDFYDLQQGNEPVTLTGRHTSCLIQGFPFRFDGPVGEESEKNRAALKKKARNSWLWIIAAIIIILVVGFVLPLIPLD